MSSRVYPSLERKPGKQNWVDKTGGLPSYIERIAKHLHYEKGRTIGAAIATAVETTRRWCSTGKNWNGGDLKPATRAKACKAVASWEAKKAKSKAKTAAKKLKESAEMTEARDLIEAKGALPCDDAVAKELAGLVKKRLMIAEGMLPVLTEPKTIGKAGLVRAAVELLEAELADDVSLAMLGGPAADPRDMKAVADLMTEEVEELRALAESLGDMPPWEKPNPKGKKGKKKGKKLSPAAKAKAKAKAKKAGRKYPNLVDNMAAAKEMEEMKRGSKGDAVKRVQTQIEMMECYIGDAGADGRFGYHTERGVKSIQRRHHLKADGIVGPKTIALLDSKVPESLLEGGVYDTEKGSKVVGGETKPAPFTKKDREAGLTGAADPDFEKKHPRGEDGKWIEKGASGASVTKIQKKIGMDKPSGKFDTATVKAVRNYQRENDLQVDGIVGQQTAASMMGKEAPVGELTDAQRKWLSSDSNKQMKESAFVPGWDTAGSRFDRTSLTEAVDKGKIARWLDGIAATAMKGDAAGLAEMFGSESWPSEWDADIDEMLYEGDDDKLEAMRKVIKAVRNSGDTKRDEAYFRSVLADDDEGMEDDDKKDMEEADVAGSGAAEAATDGNAVETPEGPPNLRESRGGDMRCETCEYFEDGKCVAHGGHPVKGTQVCDSWEAEAANMAEGMTVEVEVSIEKGESGEHESESESEGYGEEGEEKCDCGHEWSEGEHYCPECGCEKEEDGEAEGGMMPGFAPRLTEASVARRGLRAIRSIDLPSIDLPDRKRAPRPIYRLPDGTFAPKGTGAILRPGDEVTISGKRGRVSADGKSIEVPGEKAKKVAPDARAAMASPASPGSGMDSPGDLSALERDNLRRGVEGLISDIESEWGITPSGYSQDGTDPGDQLLNFLDDFVKSGASGDPDPVGNLIRGADDVRMEWGDTDDVFDAIIDSLASFGALTGREAELRGEKDGMASPDGSGGSEWGIDPSPASTDKQMLLGWSGKYRLTYQPSTKSYELMKFEKSDGSGRRWAEPKSISKDLAVQLISSRGEGMDAIVEKELGDVPLVEPWPGYPGPAQREGAMASPDAASMTAPLVTPERRRLSDRLTQVKNALYPFRGAVTDTEARDRLREEYVRLREVLNKDALLRGQAIMGSPDEKSPAYKKAKEEIAKLSFNDLLEKFPLDMAASEDTMRRRLAALRASELRRSGQMASPDAADYAKAKADVDAMTFNELVEQFPDEWGATEEKMRYRLTMLRAQEIDRAEREADQPPSPLATVAMASPDVPEPADLRDMNIASIADLIAQDWGNKVNYAAKPYLEAMFALDSLDSPYYAEKGSDIVPYFLSNARSWRGPVAKAVKAELNKRLDDHYAGMRSPAFGDSVPDWPKTQETIDEVKALLDKKDGFSMDLKGEYEMVASLVPGFEDMGVFGGDPNFPSQTKYSPDEMLRILAYLSNDLGDEDGAGGDSGYALASDILYSLSAGEEGPWGGPWEGPEVDNALGAIGWLVPGAGQDDEMASPDSRGTRHLKGVEKYWAEKFEYGGEIKTRSEIWNDLERTLAASGEDTSVGSPGRTRIERVIQGLEATQGREGIGNEMASPGLRNYGRKAPGFTQPDDWQRTSVPSGGRGTYTQYRRGAETLLYSHNKDEWTYLGREGRRTVTLDEAQEIANAPASEMASPGDFPGYNFGPRSKSGYLRVSGADDEFIVDEEAVADFTYRSADFTLDPPTFEAANGEEIGLDELLAVGEMLEIAPGRLLNVTGVDLSQNGGLYRLGPDGVWKDGIGNTMTGEEATSLLSSTSDQMGSGLSELRSVGRRTGMNSPGSPELRPILDRLYDAQSALADSGKDDEIYMNFLNDAYYELGEIEGRDPALDWVRESLTQLFGGYGPEADTQENHEGQVASAIADLEQFINTGRVDGIGNEMGSPDLNARARQFNRDYDLGIKRDGDIETDPNGGAFPDYGVGPEYSARYTYEAPDGGVVIDRTIGVQDKTDEGGGISVVEEVETRQPGDEDGDTSDYNYRYLNKPDGLIFKSTDEAHEWAKKWIQGPVVWDNEQMEILGIITSSPTDTEGGSFRDGPMDNLPPSLLALADKPETWGMASPDGSPGVWRKPRVADAAGWELDPENDFYLPVRVERPTDRAEGSDLAPGALRAWYKVTAPGERPKYFFGESAWSDAERYARDQHSKLMRERDPWLASPDDGPFDASASANPGREGWEVADDKLDEALAYLNDGVVSLLNAEQDVADFQVSYPADLDGWPDPDRSLDANRERVERVASAIGEAGVNPEGKQMLDRASGDLRNASASFASAIDALRDPVMGEKFADTSELDDIADRVEGAVVYGETGGEDLLPSLERLASEAASIVGVFTSDEFAGSGGMASPDVMGVRERNLGPIDSKRAAISLQVGDMVRLDDGEFVEVTDLQSTRVPGSGLGVAIWTEGDDAPIRVGAFRKVVVRDPDGPVNRTEWLSPDGRVEQWDNDGAIRSIDPEGILINGAENAQEGSSVKVGQKWDGEPGDNYTGGTNYYKIADNTWESTDGDTMTSSEIETSALDFVRELMRNPTALHKKVGGPVPSGLSPEDRIAQTEFDQEKLPFRLNSLPASALNKMLAGPLGDSEFEQPIQAELDRRAALGEDVMPSPDGPLAGDLVGQIMDFESGNLSDEETIDLFQQLVDSGMAWSLQGSYGRTAQALIDAGLVTPPGDGMASPGQSPMERAARMMDAQDLAIAMGVGANFDGAAQMASERIFGDDSAAAEIQKAIDAAKGDGIAGMSRRQLLIALGLQDSDLSDAELRQRVRAYRET